MDIEPQRIANLLQRQVRPIMYDFNEPHLMLAGDALLAADLRLARFKRAPLTKVLLDAANAGLAGADELGDFLGLLALAVESHDSTTRTH